MLSLAVSYSEKWQYQERSATRWQLELHRIWLLARICLFELHHKWPAVGMTGWAVIWFFWTRWTNAIDNWYWFWKICQFVLWQQAMCCPTFGESPQTWRRLSFDMEEAQLSISKKLQEHLAWLVARALASCKSFDLFRVNFAMHCNFLRPLWWLAVQRQGSKFAGIHSFDSSVWQFGMVLVSFTQESS